MEIIGNAFAQGIVPGVVIAIVYVVEKIISSRKKDPLNDIAKLLNIVTKDIIEKDKEKSKAIVKVALSYGGSEYIKFVNTTIVNNNIDANRELLDNEAVWVRPENKEDISKAIEFCINNKSVFGRRVLDQGYYPEGIYTAPSDEALKNDILYMKGRQI